MAMITDVSLASAPRPRGLAFGREFCGSRPRARPGARPAWEFDRASGRAHLSLDRQCVCDGDGQSGVGRPEAGGDLGIYRHAGLPLHPADSPRRSGPDLRATLWSHCRRAVRQKKSYVSYPRCGGWERAWWRLPSGPVAHWAKRPTCVSPWGRRGSLSARPGTFRKYDRADGRGRCNGPFGQQDA